MPASRRQFRAASADRLRVYPLTNIISRGAAFRPLHGRQFTGSWIVPRVCAEWKRRKRRAPSARAATPLTTWPAGCRQHAPAQEHLGDNLRDDFAAVDGGALIAAVMQECQFLVVHSQQMQK